MKNNLQTKTFLLTIFKIFIWSVLLPATTIFCVEIINLLDFNWLYHISPNVYYFFNNLYRFLTSSILMFLLIVIWVFGVCMILYGTIKKLFSYINALSEAADKLFDKESEFIALPQELEEVQEKINHLKRESEKNERRAILNEQRKNDLVVYLAHDLKTPLTSMIGYLSLLDEIKDMPPESREKYISIALEKSYKLEDLINELFDITRFNSEKIILEREDVNLNMMLEQIMDDFYPVLKENDKEIKLTSKSKILLDADPDKLARVFNNLIKNAIYYSTDKLITINVTKTEKSVKIIVSNKGRKIPQEKLNRIFEKFYRADASRHQASGGTGLGLAIAKEIVELHDGTITATSDELHTKFTVLLPIKKIK